MAYLFYFQNHYKASVISTIIDSQENNQSYWKDKKGIKCMLRFALIKKI